jgi:iron complex outermembrane receptor protein
MRYGGRLRAGWVIGCACLSAQVARAESQPTVTPAPAGTANGPSATAVATDSSASLDGLIDIIVTARRVREPLQRTPVSETAIEAASLDAGQVTNFSQLPNLAPGLTVSGANGQPGAATLFLRGQGSTDALIAIDKAVGTYINGVYSARSSGGAFDLVDVSQVEVLRGPQGTLFGRNTTGGAINVIPAEPDGALSALLRADYGNYNAFLGQVVVNLPLVADQLDARIAYQHSQHDGYGYNETLHQRVGAANRDYVRGSVKYAPAGSVLSVLIAGDYMDVGADQVTGLKSYTPTSANQSLILACSGSFGAALAAACPYGKAGDSYSNYVYGQNGNDDIFHVYNGTPSYGRIKSHGVSSTIDVSLWRDIAVKSITAWRGVNVSALTDFDGTPYDLTGGVRASDGNFTDEHQFSQELQLAGKALDRRLQFIVGGFYFVESGRDLSGSSSVYPLSPLDNLIDGTVRNRSLAGYGQATFSLTGNLRATGGLRYTSDQRSMVIRNNDLNLFTGADTPAYLPTDGDPADPFRASFRASYGYWSYTFGADWQAAPGIFLYAKTSRASRSGGFNTRAVSGGLPPVAFGPETVTDYELGEKIDLFDKHIRIDTSGFYSRLANAQRNIVGVVAGNRVVSGAENAASAHIFGGEAELSVIPARGLIMSGSVALVLPKYDHFVSTVDGTDLSDTPFLYSPKEIYTASVDYNVPLMSARKVLLHLDYSYRTKQYAVSLKNSAFTPAQNQALQDTAKIPGYGLLNARVALQLKQPDIELAIFCRNITATQYFSYLLPLEGTALGYTSYSPGDPRTFGVSATLRL